MLGALSNAIGTALIFRSGQIWARVWVTLLGLGMVTCWCLYAVRTSDGRAMVFWWTLIALTPVHAWGAAIEAISLARQLSKRARLGLADPIVVNRTLQWGLCSVCVFTSTTLSITARYVYGPVSPPWISGLASLILVLGAAAIWLGLFPPAAYRARLLRPSEGA